MSVIGSVIQISWLSVVLAEDKVIEAGVPWIVKTTPSFKVKFLKTNISENNAVAVTWVIVPSVKSPFPSSSINNL